MSTIDLQRPFPDYVLCPHCAEPEVEVWCYDPLTRCHACGQVFAHAQPVECVEHCDRARCGTGQPAAKPSP